MGDLSEEDGYDARSSALDVSTPPSLKIGEESNPLEKKLSLKYFPELERGLTIAKSKPAKGP